MNIEDVKKHIRDRGYMTGVERDKTRVKSTGEVFTPSPLCQDILDQLEQNDPNFFNDSSKTFLDPSCGDGQILGEVLIRKMERGSTFEQALGTIYGVEFKEDNVAACKERLLCGQTQYRHIVDKNIINHDALTYDYLFGEKETFGPSGLFEVIS
jgi:type I restriction-modification system DNA methylase subunit